jgi:hypothetical protein
MLGLTTLITMWFYYKLETPEKMAKGKEISEYKDTKLQLPSYSVYLISAAFLFAVGQ